MDSSSDQLSQVELLAEEFLDRQHRGEKPTIREYCERHPELADEIRSVFEAVAMVEDLKPDSRDASGTLGEGLEVAARSLQQVGDYRILREIGRGGMGVVYEAEQESLGRRVALKVLPRQAAGDKSSIQRFQREARAAARMHHTNIVPVFEVGQEDDLVFYAMQLIQGQGLDLVIGDLRKMRTERVGGPLGASAGAVDASSVSASPRGLAASLVTGEFEQKLLAEPDAKEGTLAESSHGEQGDANGALTETIAFGTASSSSARLPGRSEISTAESDRSAYFNSVAEIGLQAAQALAYAHVRGIIHRDIKPSNLLLDTTGVVWVTDFGLAKTSDSAITHTGDILGTLRYMSPERFNGCCDVRADVFSLGLTLYELLVLKPAFESPDRVKLIDMMVHKEVEPPRSIDPRIPRDLETIVLKACDKEPQQRYQSADDMVDDLQRFVHDEPILARRVSLFERFSRWSGRNKALSATLMALAVSLILIAVGAVWLAKMTYSSNLRYISMYREIRELLAEKEGLVAAKEVERKNAVTEKEAARRSRYDSDMNSLQYLLQDPSSLTQEIRELLIFHAKNSADLLDHRYYFIKNLLENSAVEYVVPDAAKGPMSAAFGAGSTVLTLSATGQLNRWGESRNDALESFDLSRGADVRYAVLSQDGRRAALASADGWLHLFDISAAPKRLFHKDLGGLVLEMEFVNGSQQLSAAVQEWPEPLPALPVIMPDQPSRLLGFSTTMTFDNRWNEEVRVSWISSKGRKVLRKRLPAAELWQGTCDAGRIFVVENANDVLIGVFRANKRPGLVTIEGHSATAALVELRWSTFDVATGEQMKMPARSQLDKLTGMERRLYLSWRRNSGTNAMYRETNARSLRFSQDTSTVVIPHYEQPKSDYEHCTVTWLDGDGTPHQVKTDSTIYRAATARDMRIIAVSSNQGQLRVIDRNSGMMEEVKDHAEAIQAIEFSIDDRLLATGGSDGLLNVYDMSSSLEPVRKVHIKAHTEPITGLCFDDRGQRLISTTDSGEVRVWDLERRRGKVTIPFPGHVYGHDVSPDRRLLAIPFGLWNLNPPYRRQALPPGQCYKFSPDGSLLAVGGFNSVQLIHVETGESTELPCVFPEGTAGFGLGAASIGFSPDGRYLAAGFGGSNQQATIRRKHAALVWNVESKKQVHQIIHFAPVSSLDFSPAGDFLATVGKRSEVAIHQIASGKGKSWGQLMRWKGLPMVAKFSPDGSKLAVVYRKSSETVLKRNTHIKLLDTAKPPHEWPWEEGREIVLAPQINALAFSPNSAQLLAGGADNVIRSWDWLTGRVVFKYPVKGVVSSLTVSAPPAGRSRKASTWAVEETDHWLAAAVGRSVVLWPTVPSAWNHPRDAAEILNRDLDRANSTKDWGGRDLILSAAALHPESLARLMALRPGDLRLQLAKVESLQLHGKHSEATRLMKGFERKFDDLTSTADKAALAHAYADAIQMRVFDEAQWRVLDLEVENGGTAAKINHQQNGLGVQGEEEVAVYANCTLPLSSIRRLRIEVLPEVGRDLANWYGHLELGAFSQTDHHGGAIPISLEYEDERSHFAKLTPPGLLRQDGEGTSWLFFTIGTTRGCAVLSCAGGIDNELQRLKFVLRSGPDGVSRRIRISVSDQNVSHAVIGPASRLSAPGLASEGELAGLIRLATALYLADDSSRAKNALQAATEVVAQVEPKQKKAAFLWHSDARVLLLLGALIENDPALLQRATTVFPQWHFLTHERQLLRLAHARLNGLSVEDAGAKATAFWQDCRKAVLKLETPLVDEFDDRTLRFRATHYVERERWADAAMELQRVVQRSPKPDAQLWANAVTLHAFALKSGYGDAESHRDLWEWGKDRFPGADPMLIISFLLVPDNAEHVSDAPEFVAKWIQELAGKPKGSLTTDESVALALEAHRNQKPGVADYAARAIATAEASDPRLQKAYLSMAYALRSLGNDAKPEPELDLKKARQHLGRVLKYRDGRVDGRSVDFEKCHSSLAAELLIREAEQKRESAK